MLLTLARRLRPYLDWAHRVIGGYGEEALSSPSLDHLGRARIYRGVTYGLIAVATLLTHYTAIYKAGVPAGHGPDDLPSLSTSAYLVATALGAVHLYYLFTVSGQLIFFRPLEHLRFPDFLLPLLLTAGYAASTYEVVTASYIKLTSTLIFVVLYLVWALRDLRELALVDTTRARNELARWFRIDMSLVVFLLITLAYRSGILHPKAIEDVGHAANNALPWARAITAKDVSISLCVVFTLFSRSRSRAERSEKFPQNYRQYVANIRLTSELPPPPRKAASARRILDYGGGDGSRTKQLLDMLRIADRSAVKVTILERERDWEQFLVDPGFRFTTQREAVKPEEFDLVYVSHALYDRQLLRDVAEFVKYCAVGTVVVVRGFAPNSVMAAANHTYSLNRTSGAFSYLWNRVGVEFLMRRAKLRLILEDDVLNPVVIKQGLKLNQAAINSLCATLETVHCSSPLETLQPVATAGAALRRYLEDLGGSSHRLDEASNDDLVFFLERVL